MEHIDCDNNYGYDCCNDYHHDCCNDYHHDYSNDCCNNYDNDIAATYLNCEEPDKIGSKNKNKAFISKPPEIPESDSMDSFCEEPILPEELMKDKEKPVWFQIALGLLALGYLMLALYCVEIFGS